MVTQSGTGKRAPKQTAREKRIKTRIDLLLKKIDEIIGAAKGQTTQEKLDNIKLKVEDTLARASVVTHRAKNRNAEKLKVGDGIYYLPEQLIDDGLISSLSVPPLPITDGQFEFSSGANYAKYTTVANELFSDDGTKLAAVQNAGVMHAAVAKFVIDFGEKLIERDKVKQSAQLRKAVPGELPITAYLDENGNTQLITPIHSSVMLRRWHNAVSDVREHIFKNRIVSKAITTAVNFGAATQPQNISAIPMSYRNTNAIVHANTSSRHRSEHEKILYAIVKNGLRTNLTRIIPSLYNEVLVMASSTYKPHKNKLNENLGGKIIDRLREFFNLFDDRERQDLQLLASAYRIAGNKITREESHLLAVLSGHADPRSFALESACQLLVNCVANIAIKSKNGEFTPSDASILYKSMLNNIQVS